MGNRLLLIIPAYNEEENIERVVGNIREHYPQYDYVVINDGSSDRTSEICHRLRFNVIDHPVNLGLEGAFQTGMKYAFYRGYECAVQFDADGQHRPEYIEKMYDAMREGYDVVIGEGTEIHDSIIMNGVRIGSGCYLEKAIIAEDTYIGDNVHLGGGEDRPNDTRPDIYNSGLVTVAERSIIPGNVYVGMNSVLSGELTHDDFPGGRLPSGSTLIKGGERR